MLLLLLACNATPFQGWSRDPGSDSQDSDTAASSDTPLDLERSPRWESEESGVATGLAFADVDQDGDPDLLVSYGNDIQRGPIALYENVDGKLQERAAWTSSGLHYYGHISAADVNGDGFPDLVASRFIGDGGFSETGGVELFLNQGGTLSTQPDWSAGGFHSFNNTLGDLDGDGDLDLAVAVGEPYHSTPASSLVFENDGSGDFGASQIWSSPPGQALDVGLADLDGDGWLDLVLANVGTPHAMYPGGPDGLSDTPSWLAAGEDTRFEGNTLDIGDIDGDGHLDLVISDNLQLGGAGTVSVYCGPDWARCWESQDDPLYQSAVRLEDVDGDDTLDLVAGAWGPEGSLGASVRIYLNQGEALEPEPSWISSPTSVIEALAFGDLDGSSSTVEVISGQGLQPIPRGRVVEASGACTHEGWASGPGEWSVSVLLPIRRDLAVSNWDKDIGNHLYGRSTP
ncbi:MAG: VCBS repeat-containing protein [Myxococcota bacterium]|nr:VCBS repeat-containing protein [Myxococcota bacterium]